jgi:hypothetical protein
MPGSRYGPTGEKGRMLNSSIPWAQICCVMFSMFFAAFVKYHFKKWLNSWLENRAAMRRIHRNIQAQQRRMYS